MYVVSGYDPTPCQHFTPRASQRDPAGYAGYRRWHQESNERDSMIADMQVTQLAERDGCDCANGFEYQVRCAHLASAYVCMDDFLPRSWVLHQYVVWWGASAEQLLYCKDFSSREAADRFFDDLCQQLLTAG